MTAAPSLTIAAIVAATVAAPVGAQGTAGAWAAPAPPRAGRAAIAPSPRVAPPGGDAPGVTVLPGTLFTTPMARLTPEQRRQLQQYGAGETPWRGVQGTRPVWMRIPCAACPGGVANAIVFVRNGAVEAVQPVGAPGARAPLQVPWPGRVRRP